MIGPHAVSPRPTLDWPQELVRLVEPCWPRLCKKSPQETIVTSTSKPFQRRVAINSEQTQMTSGRCRHNALKPNARLNLLMLQFPVSQGGLSIER
jgi:hypothetical protein